MKTKRVLALSVRFLTALVMLGLMASAVSAAVGDQSKSLPWTRGDLNGDGQADIVFEDDDGWLAAWLMKGTSMGSATLITPSKVGDRNYRVVGTGDFNRDGQEDLLFQHTDGTLAVWQMNGTSLVAGALLDPRSPGDRNWRVSAIGDFDRDGKDDLLFQHTDGTLAVWYLDGLKLRSGALLNPGNPGEGWRVIGAADFNSDGMLDLFFQHRDGTLAVWFVNGVAMTSAALLSPSSPGSSQWRVASVTDRNQDGKPDLLFQHSGDGTLAVWFLDGTRLSSGALSNPSGPGGTWKAAASNSLGTGTETKPPVVATKPPVIQLTQSLPEVVSQPFFPIEYLVDGVKKSLTLSLHEGVNDLVISETNSAGQRSDLKLSVVLDAAPPSGSIVINDNRSMTSRSDVRVHLQVTDLTSGTDDMRFSVDGGQTWSNWEPYQADKNVRLSGEAGTKTVIFEVRDKLKNTGQFRSSITLAPYLVKAINCGGDAVGNFVADTDFSGGNRAEANSTVDTAGLIDPAPLPVYQTERWGEFSYSVSSLTPNAPYLLRLHFAEVFGTRAGLRVFNVLIQGASVLKNFDIVAATSAPNRAMVREFVTAADSNGKVVIQFVRTLLDFPKCSGIEIFTTQPVQPVNPPTPPPPTTPSTNPPSSYPRVFAADSFWYTPIPDNAPLHPNSANFVVEFLRQKNAYYGNVNINTVEFASPVYVVDAEMPPVRATEFDCQNRGYFPPLSQQWTAVPIPSYAETADGTDAEMTIYQPSTDQIWEFWNARKVNGQWQACWGGSMQNVSKSSGIWTFPFGATATGLPFLGGQITAEELQRGEINHVIGIAMVDHETWSIYSWPANRSDGWNPDGVPNRIPEGLRFRLDPKVNVDALNLHPVARIIAQAAQKYGFVVWDHAGGLALRAQNPKSYTKLGQADPYVALFNKTPAYAILDGVPWDRLLFLPMDYGKP